MRKRESEREEVRLTEQRETVKSEFWVSGSLYIYMERFVGLIDYVTKTYRMRETKKLYVRYDLCPNVEFLAISNL